jgi:hypothetical protein
MFDFKILNTKHQILNTNALLKRLLFRIFSGLSKRLPDIFFNGRNTLGCIDHNGNQKGSVHDQAPGAQLPEVFLKTDQQKCSQN